MSTSFMGFGMFLFVLPILIAEWVGIIGLGKVGRSSAWWCMMSGVACSSIGAISTTIYTIMMMTGVLSFPSFGTVAMIASSSLSGLGSLLFAIGFAIHGMQASRANQRIHELEAIAAAQGQELDRHRAAQGSAG